MSYKEQITKGRRQSLKNKKKTVCFDLNGTSSVRVCVKQHTVIIIVNGYICQS